jgi:hypothetical protein
MNKASTERIDENIIKNKEIFTRISAALIARLRNNEPLTGPSITAILADISVSLGLSTLDLTTFAPDKYSDGTSVNIDQPFNYRRPPDRT